jgi:hypothetical protein
MDISVVAEAEAEAEADDVGALPIALIEARIELACEGSTVMVVEGPVLLPLPLPLAPLWPLFRTSGPSPSGCALMKVISGPATIALLCRSTAPPFNGWSSDVIQIATGPLMPAGTTHWLIGREREKGMPPMSIWQW